MRPSAAKKIVHILLLALGGLLIACLLLAGVSAGYNAAQPDHSAVVERLSDASKAHALEVDHLRRTLGEQVWPGWGKAEIPILLFNEQYAFLTGLTDPPPGWKLPLKTSIYGGAWQVVPEDDLAGKPYYRQPARNPSVTIGNFTVQIGPGWAVSMETQEYAGISFRQGFRADLPPLVRDVFPYGLVYSQLLGRSDVYLGGLAHEAFHAYQGQAAPERLIEAERAASLVDRYPWDQEGVTDAWRGEMTWLRRGMMAQSDEDALDCARQFLTSRRQRRQSTGLSAEMMNVERQREWLEGLAKYAELRLGRTASLTPGYAPIPEMQADRAFRGWASYRIFYDQQVDQIDKIVEPGETWFYYSGFAQAALLDRFLPGWKEHAFQPGIFLEDLLAEGVKK